MHATPVSAAPRVLRALRAIPLLAGLLATRDAPAQTPTRTEARLSGTATFRQHGDTVWFVTTARPRTATAAPTHTPPPPARSSGAEFVFLLRGDTAILLAPKVPQPIMPHFGRTLRDMLHEAQAREPLLRRLDALGVPRARRAP